jgi:cytochrome c
MNRPASLALLGAIGALIASAPAFAQPAAGDAAHGAVLFNQRCVSCHAPPGRFSIGPSLIGVVGRKAGSLAGARYSPALVASGLTWDKATLNTFLTAPDQVVKGGNMITAVPDATDRADIIAYLAKP